MTASALTDTVAESGTTDAGTSDISGTDQTAEPTSAARGRRGLRRGVLAAAATVAIAVGGLGLATTASANVVNLYGPHHTWSWGDCTLTLGNVRTVTGNAEGGFDVTCGHRRGHINAIVTLWRFDGVRWVAQSSSGWHTIPNSYGLSSWTGQVCGGGSALWNDTATVNVDGSQISLNLDAALGYAPRYTPPAC